MTNVDNRLVRYAGTVFIGKLTASGDNANPWVKGPLTEMGQLDILEISAPEQDSVELLGSNVENFEEVIDRDIGKVKRTLEFTTLSAKKAQMEIAFAGLTANVTRTATTIATPEEITIAELDKWYPLDDDRLDAATPAVVTDDLDATITQTSNYEIDYSAGLIRALSGGAIAVNDVISVTYTTLDKTGYKLTADKNTDQRYWMMINNVNRHANGGAAKIIIDNCQIVQSGAMQRLSKPDAVGEYATLSYTVHIDGDMTIEELY